MAANRKLNSRKRNIGSIRKEGVSIYLGRGQKRAMVKIDGLPLFAIPEGSTAESVAFEELGVR